mmetsp:Transcript_39783/g.117966  ORF Transcript_39783/g.117966 Transcript_39783/m.117966 type:complete len:251 (-) Transcript_39783:49-801(-)
MPHEQQVLDNVVAVRVLDEHQRAFRDGIHNPLPHVALRAVHALLEDAAAPLVLAQLHCLLPRATELLQQLLNLLGGQLLHELHHDVEAGDAPRQRLQQVSGQRLQDFRQLVPGDRLLDHLLDGPGPVHVVRQVPQLAPQLREEAFELLCRGHLQDLLGEVVAVLVAHELHEAQLRLLVDQPGRLRRPPQEGLLQRAGLELILRGLDDVHRLHLLQSQQRAILVHGLLIGDGAVLPLGGRGPLRHRDGPPG